MPDFSFRSRFRFTRHSEKKVPSQQPAPVTPKAPSAKQQVFKFPLMMDSSYSFIAVTRQTIFLSTLLSAATLSPVPEADDYESSELSLSDIVIRSSSATLNSSSKRQPLIKSERKQNLAVHNQQQVTNERSTPESELLLFLSVQSLQTTKVVQALVHAEQSQHVSDDYYKRIEHVADDSNYTTMPGTGAGESSIADQETDRSLGNEMDGGGPVLVSVPTMFRREDDTGTATDTGESIYNQNYSLQSIAEVNRSTITQWTKLFLTLLSLCLSVPNIWNRIQRRIKPVYLQPPNHRSVHSNLQQISRSSLAIVKQNFSR